jgi:hypothetical protein
MMSKNERMEKLNQAGINTSKYFTVNLDNGTKIHLIVDENGNCTQVKNDNIAEHIIADGYVRNTKLHRRFVMAQMFHMLNYVSFNGRESGYNAYLNNMYGYQYTIDMMIEEIKVLSKLEVRDQESFVERSHFFNKNIVVKVLEDYLDKLKKYIDTIPNKNCKGVPYKRIKGANIFVADIDKKLYRPIRNKIYNINREQRYDKIYKELVELMRYDFIKLPYNTHKSKDWIDAYKGEGAYYTLKNLVMFHDCGIENLYGMPMLYGTGAVNYIKRKLDEYQNEGWRMFALMKKVIEDNNFDFQERMEELGVY